MTPSLSADPYLLLFSQTSLQHFPLASCTLTLGHVSLAPYPSNMLLQGPGTMKLNPQLLRHGFFVFHSTTTSLGIILEPTD